MHDQYPIPTGVVAEVSRVFLGDLIEIGFSGFVFRVAKLGCERDESAI